MDARLSEHEPTLTALLTRWRHGDRAVEAQLIDQLYPALKRLAQAQLQRVGAHEGTLRPTELAHEAYLRLCQQDQGEPWRDRAQFFAFAAGMLRHIVVDHLRNRAAVKRGGTAMFIDLDRVGDLAASDDQVDWLAVDQALDALQARDAECAAVVELRVFAGLSVEEIAQVRHSSVATVGRRWRFARAWLADRLQAESTASER